MTDKQNSIKILFGIDFSYEKFRASDCINMMEYLKDIIPDSELYYERIYSLGSGAVTEAKERGLEQEKKGKTLYMFNDDPDFIHWFAMHGDYYILVKGLKKFLNYQFVESFNAADMS